MLRDYQLSNLPYVDSLAVMNMADTLNAVKDSSKKAKSRYKGVFKCGKKFKAQIQTNGVQHYLGLFDSEEDAAKAYDTHARVVLGPKAKTNFEYDPNEVLPPMPDFTPVSSAPATSLSAIDTQTSSLQIMQMGLSSQLPNEFPVVPPAPPVSKGGAHPKRTYVGIKLRRKKGLSGAHTIQPLSSSSNSLLSSLQVSTTMHQQPQVDQFGNLVTSGDFPYSTTYGTAAGLLQASSNLYDNQSAASRKRSRESAGGQEYAYGYGGAENCDRDDDRLADEEDDEDEGDEPDWREQIYYWTGLLSVDVAQKRLLWKGTWVGSYTGRPAESEFAASTNFFEYFSDQIHDISSVYAINSAGVSTKSLSPPSSFFKGFYMMDNDGSGLERYLDKEHYIDFERVMTGNNELAADCLGIPGGRNYHPTSFAETHNDPTHAVYSVIGKGDSDFGAFIVTGVFHSATSVLEMSRHYIADDDARCHMDLLTLKQHIKLHPM